MEIKIEVRGTEFRIAQTENDTMFTVVSGDTAIATPITYEELSRLIGAMNFVVMNRQHGSDVERPYPPAYQGRGLMRGQEAGPNESI